MNVNKDINAKNKNNALPTTVSGLLASAPSLTGSQMLTGADVGRTFDKVGVDIDVAWQKGAIVLGEKLKPALKTFGNWIENNSDKITDFFTNVGNILATTADLLGTVFNMIGNTLDFVGSNIDKAKGFDTQEKRMVAQSLAREVLGGTGTDASLFLTAGSGSFKSAYQYYKTIGQTQTKEVANAMNSYETSHGLGGEDALKWELAFDKSIAKIIQAAGKNPVNIMIDKSGNAIVTGAGNSKAITLNGNSIQ